MTARPTLLFDLDGTLIDSHPDIFNALNATLKKHGREPVGAAESKQLVGDGSRKLVERAFEATGGLVGDLDRLLADFLEIYSACATDKTAPYPGVVGTLDRLLADGYAMAVCTNKPIKPTLQILDAMDLSRYFKDVAGGDSFAVRKPDPGHLTGLLDRMGKSSSNAIMIGDSENDILAGQAANLPTILLTFGYCRVPLESLSPSHQLDDFRDIPDVLARY
ncbi:HAD-IA family hydrolase [Aestuariispira insulae]|uniref:Phosphoglycolate phosphatase n=1 Tax=Aestuariispira insulae TaxID=1461337 RepID=A0A3D9HY09_9PROT|nr:HAD-IA family hydrolase [Aestuariispira insulae]RED54384.1 phosphoglycolate phosphatase [Aestuariispira insulae]